MKNENTKKERKSQSKALMCEEGVTCLQGHTENNNEKISPTFKVVADSG